MAKETPKENGNAPSFASLLFSQLTTSNLKLAMNVTFFGLSVYTIKNYGHYLTLYFLFSFFLIVPPSALSLFNFFCQI